MSEFKYKFCKGCGHNIEVGSMDSYEVVDGILHHCPRCNHPLVKETFSGVQADYADPTKSIAEYAQFLPTVDQLNYVEYILNKQLAKVTKAQKQLFETITKIQIMREIAKENEA